MANRARVRRTTVGRIDEQVLAFTAGRDLELDRHLVEADCLGSIAHAAMLARVRARPPLLTAAQAARLRRALVAILRDAAAGRFAIRPGDQDVHLAIERTLTERLGEVGRRIHVGRSRNDQVAVDLRLYAKGQLLDAMDEAAVLAAVLAEFAARHAEWPMVGRTHMQPAMPSSVGCWASSFAESLLDDLALLRGAYEINDQCPLGSAAGYGVPLPIARRFVSDLLGFARPTHNVIYAGQARGKIEAVVLSALGQAMLTLSRLAQDLILYGMPEFGYFRFPPQFGTGSSIMPQKNNPDVLELVRARAARVLACGAAVQEILRAAPSGYNRDLQETKEPFFEGLATTRACLRVLAPLVADTRVDAKALAAGFTPAVFATDRALDLVARGLPFRDAYDRVKARLGELEGADPAAAVRRKTHLGAPAGVDYGALRSRIAAARAWVVRHRTAFHAALSRLLGVAYPLAR